MNSVLAALTTNYGAVAVCLFLATPAIGAIIRGVRAPDALQERYGEDRRDTRAKIEGDRIVPRLGALAFELLPSLGSEDPIDDESRRRLIQAQLQKTDYMDAVEELSTLAADYRDLQRSQDEAQRWSRRKALAAGVYLLGLSYPAAVASLDGPSFPRFPLYIALSVAGLGAAFAITFFFQESGARNRLIAIVRRYE